MPSKFQFDPRKSAEQNIDDFIIHIESVDATFGSFLRTNLAKMLPLPDQSKRSAARASFNAEIRKQLDAMAVWRKATHA